MRKFSAHLSASQIDMFVSATKLMRCFLEPVYNESLAKGPFLVTAAVTYAWNATECLLQQYQEVNELQVVKVLCDEIFGKKYDCSAIVAVSVPDGITTVTFNGSYPEQIGLEATKSVFVRQWLNFSGEFVSDYFASAAQKLYNNGLKTAFADIMGRHPKHEVRITGLSLGGALATLFSDLIVTDGLADPTQIRIITYGEPKVGNQLFSLNHVGRVGGYVFRLINRRDPIPLLPYALLDLLQPYAEHQFEVRYPSGTDAGYVVCDGSIYCPPHPFPYPEFILDNLMDHLTYFAPPNKTIADFGAQNCHWQ
uniref:Lipase_3 domain-containing protein n=1 Tax=Steinernema glaseri TaxID=37863 RepID=A0A1I7XZF8_9BILA